MREPPEGWDEPWWGQGSPSPEQGEKAEESRLHLKLEPQVDFLTHFLICLVFHQTLPLFFDHSGEEGKSDVHPVRSLDKYFLSNLNAPGTVPGTGNSTLAKTGAHALVAGGWDLGKSEGSVM